MRLPPRYFRVHYERVRRSYVPYDAGRGDLHHKMSERLAAYYRRGYLIRDRVKALGLSK